MSSLRGDRLVVRVAATSACVLLGTPIFGAAAAQAASFDCKKASTPVEKLICDSIDLEMLDSQMNGAFQGAQERSNNPPQVKASQVAWLRARDSCRDKACLEASYRKRIATLMAVSESPPECEGPTSLSMDDCAATYADRADKELVRYLAVARADIADSAKQSGESSNREALEDFDEAQNAWAEYREAECGAVYSRWISGTIRILKNLSCRTAITKARTHQVWATWLRFVDNTPPLLPEPRREPKAP